jgi:FixJ family two-component response regulator
MSDHPPSQGAIYVVDDDAAVLHALKFSLGIEGFDVAVFPSAGELLAHGGAGEVDCLILDYRLPDMTGLDLAHLLRDRGVTTPMILITSNPGTDLLRRASAAGVQVVEKPLIGSTLTTAVRDSLAAA